MVQSMSNNNSITFNPVIKNYWLRKRLWKTRKKALVRTFRHFLPQLFCSKSWIIIIFLREHLWDDIREYPHYIEFDQVKCSDPKNGFEKREKRYWYAHFAIFYRSYFALNRELLTFFFENVFEVISENTLIMFNLIKLNELTSKTALENDKKMTFTHRYQVK